MKYLDGWIFSYSEAAKLWSATTRENAALIFNDFSSNKVLRAADFNTLQSLIIRIKGNLNSQTLNNL